MTKFEYVGVDSQGRVQWAFPDDNSHVKLVQLIQRLESLVRDNQSVPAQDIKDLLKEFG